MQPFTAFFVHLLWQTQYLVDEGRGLLFTPTLKKDHWFFSHEGREIRGQKKWGSARAPPWVRPDLLNCKQISLLILLQKFYLVVFLCDTERCGA